MNQKAKNLWGVGDQPVMEEEDAALADNRLVENPKVVLVWRSGWCRGKTGGMLTRALRTR
jgi:hypothetical protein